MKTIKHTIKYNQATNLFCFTLKQKQGLLGKKKCSYKNNKKELQNLLPWNLELLAPTSARAEETSCTKAHISPREKVQFLEIGEC